jgi:hypothetical protein
MYRFCLRSGARLTAAFAQFLFVTCQKMEHRLHQCITVLKKLTDDLGIPYSSPEVQAVKKQFDEFIRTGEPWEGSIPFTTWGRIADIALTRRGNVELTLRLSKQKK